MASFTTLISPHETLYSPKTQNKYQSDTLRKTTISHIYVKYARANVIREDVILELDFIFFFSQFSVFILYTWFPDFIKKKTCRERRLDSVRSYLFLINLS